MSTTDENPNPAPDPGPAFYRDRLRDIDQLRLSSDDRYIAGVAGGLGRHFDIDPIVIRVVLAALCVFGGIGILVYAVLWIFVPSDRTNRAIVDLNRRTRRSILGIFGVVVLLGAIGSVVGGFNGYSGHFAWPLAAIVAICAVALAYLRPENYRAHRVENMAAPAYPGLDTPESAGTSSGVGVGLGTHEGDVDDQPPSAPIPPTPSWTPPPVPPRPRRTGLILFWPTIAAIAVAFGVLGMIAVDHSVPALWWPGTALTFVGIALVIGAFAGRPGGLTLLGFLMIPGLIAATILGSNGWHHEDVSYTPTSASAVTSSYSIGTGQATLDLSNIKDPSSLAGRTIKVSMRAGEIDVTLPPGIATDVKASLDIAGDVETNGNDHGGFNPTIHQTFGSGGSAPLHLVLTGRVGLIKVNTN